MAISTQELNEQLEKLRQEKRSYLRPQQYKNFMPKTLGYQPRDTEQYYRNLDVIKERGQNALEISRTQAANRRAYQQMLEMRREAQREARNVRIMQNAAQSYADIQPRRVGLDINAPLQTYNWRGRELTLNSSVAPNFIGFLNTLYNRGYKPVSIGSYSNRNIAGTSTPSLHSYGLAIDIDPQKNPVTWNGRNITALPPDVGALAARYGLRWGGLWHGSKRDTMHFSVPYGGVE